MLRKKKSNELLKELVIDPQIPFSHITSKLKVSQNTIKKNYEKMINEKLIFYSSIIIDLSKLGFQGKARFNIITDEKERTIEALKNMANVFLIIETSGDYDLIALMAVENYDTIIDVCKTIQDIPTIKIVDVCLTKDTSFPADIKFNKLFK